MMSFLTNGALSRVLSLPLSKSHTVLLRTLLLSVLWAWSVSCSSSDEPYQIEGPKDCSLEEQNDFTYRLMRTAYYWNEFVPEGVDTGSYESPDALVKAVRYAELDPWSRVADLATSDALFEEGKVLGYGFSARRTQDDKIILAAVEEDSPAGAAELKRGEEIIALNGESIAALDASGQLQQAFGPNEPGVELELEVQMQNGAQRTLTIAKDWFPLVTVPTTEVLERGSAKVGYLVYNSFVEPSVAELNRAFERFDNEQITELVVDLRYNGGGRLVVADHLLNLIAGASSEGLIAYQIEHAQALSDADSTSQFVGEAISLEGLKRVAFITTGSTASASELVANALEPYLEVMVVGSPSAGKPVGSAQWTFCDKAAQPITFRILNADGEGDYYEGLPLTCSAEDDLFSELGDPAESSLAAVLSLLENKACPEATIDGVEARFSINTQKLAPGRSLEPLMDPSKILPELY